MQHIVATEDSNDAAIVADANDTPIKVGDSIRNKQKLNQNIAMNVAISTITLQ